MLRKEFSILFPHAIIADSKNGKPTIDDFQLVVTQGLQQLSEIPKEYSYLHNMVLNQFSRVEQLEKEFLVNEADTMLFETREDAEELLRIVSLDVKKAILDTALEAVFSHSGMSDQDTTDSNSPSDYSPSTKPRRRRPNLPVYAKDILSCWFREHVDHPYPTQAEKIELSERTGLNLQKVDNWFINERSRKWRSYRRK